ncbi:MAG: biotin carboxyl carrier protein [Francisellaceae bacterium]|nr:biotin carboxyl carrier protein [Francisellaceae bacterium]
MDIDLDKVKELIALVEESGIAEIELKEGEKSIRINRSLATNNSQIFHPSMMYAAPSQMPGVGMTNNAPPSQSENANINATPTPTGHTMTAPMVGTFYRASAPGEKPFAEVGQTVKAGQVICIIEAMKMLNQIESDHDGVIEAILVENGQPVEFSQPLFQISDKT